MSNPDELLRLADEVERQSFISGKVATELRTLARESHGAVGDGLAAYRLRDHLSRRFGVIIAIQQADELLALALPADAGGEAVEVAENAARSLYRAWCDQQDIHSNRLPGWDELDAARRSTWMDKVVAADTGNAEADNLIRRMMSADPTFGDCTDAAALIRKLATPAAPPKEAVK